MAVLLVDGPFSNGTADNTTPFTISSVQCTVAGTNGVLVVLISMDTPGSARTVSSVTWNSQSLTQATGAYKSQAMSGGDNGSVDIWYLKDANLTNTTANVTVTTNANCSCVATAFTITSVDQTTSTGTAATNGSSSNSASLTAGTLTSATGDLCVGVFTTVSGNGGSSLSSSDTQIAKQANSSGNSQVGFSSQAAGAASVTLTWSDSVPLNQGYAASSIPFKAASGGGGVVGSNYYRQVAGMGA